MNPKFNTYIAVVFQEDNRLVTKFVTSVEKSYCRWDAGEPAMKFAESTAKDYVFGLTVNGYVAMVVKLVNGVTIPNPKEDAE